VSAANVFSLVARGIRLASAVGDDQRRVVMPAQAYGKWQ
jgi:hypothetical protein